MDNKKIAQSIRAGRLNGILALMVLIVSFLIYNSTKAPTLSFWDCGEFIACSYTLGIPHPPGTPLYIIVGRIFSIIPFQQDICARVNMFSAVSAAFAAMFAFLVIVRLIRYWWREKTISGWKRAALYIGAFIGTSMFAFGRTHWTNSTEAEVYSPAMFLIIFIIWLMLRWIDSRRENGSERYLILIMFLGFLSIGIHMTVFLFLPAVFLAVILFSEKLRKDFRFYITGFCLYLISYDFIYFLVATAAWFVILIIGTLVTRGYLWKFSLLLVLAAAIGFSCQLYTPIRSAQNPSINQNDPSQSFTAFRSFLERKQYGSQNMITRAFARRAEWSHQLGNYRRMGFWGFFSKQYGFNGRPFAFLFVLGLLGIFEMIRRKPRLGMTFALMVLLGTLFLVWYMNFADGTRQHPLSGEGHIEVRDRDYFFTPGFILFGIAIGIGVAGLMEMLRESLIGNKSRLRNLAMSVVSALALLTAVPVAANHFYCDRSSNYAPYDFAYNLLMSCDENAILFNGGDNDTFPVWCIQEVYGVRPDITAINLSLSNLGWYIKQVRDYMGIPLRWSDAEIDALRHTPVANRQLLRIQDQVSDEILIVNNWARPIHFAITVSDDARQYMGRSLVNNSVMQGISYRLERGERSGAIDLEKTIDLYWNVLKFRSLQDSTIYRDERTTSLTGNYTTALLLVADSLRVLEQYDRAVEITAKAVELIPYEYSSYNYLAQLYVLAGKEELIPDLAASVPPERVKDIYYVQARVNKSVENREKAEQLFRTILDSFPTFKDAFREYTRILYEDRRFEELQEAIREWLLNNPKDEEVRRLMDEMFRPDRQPAPQPAGRDS